MEGDCPKAKGWYPCESVHSKINNGSEVKKGKLGQVSIASAKLELTAAVLSATSVGAKCHNIYR